MENKGGIVLWEHKTHGGRFFCDKSVSLATAAEFWSNIEQNRYGTCTRFELDT